MPAAPNVAVADGGTTPPVTVTVDTSVPPLAGGNADVAVWQSACEL